MSGNNVINMTVRANMDISQMSNGVTQMQGILQKLKLPDDMKKNFTSLFSTATSELEKYQAKMNSGFKTKGDVTGLEKIGKNLTSVFSQIEAEWNKLQGMDISQIIKIDSSTQARLKEIETSFKTLGSTLQNDVSGNVQQAIGLIEQLTTKSSKKGGAQIAQLLGAGEYEQALGVLDQLIAKQQQAITSFGEDGKGSATRQNTLEQYISIRDVLIGIIPKVQEYNNNVNNLDATKAQILAENIAKANGHIQQGVSTSHDLTAGITEFGNAARVAAQKTQQLSYDMDMIKSRVQYFFSLTNAAMLFRRVLQDTINTTKELDAAMTETAVVTDFSVSDMWSELPRYTALAKELGATIKGVYETMTLYYQQGLETNEVFEVGTETLKMARIAGLDYAKATDFMTAALRGFNMEVNEMNAQRINDVYSNLAAITAADTEEIATAMTKTASIASSANMEFETTAAFLSQIIETTRESAETAGTAMKTVIARFTELKKDPAEIGEVDGEIVDANKIETALRTIDVALRDSSGQFRDLDDVFIDIAAKWDGLDTNTQRYIATMAAGSRQQSRFIAMMSDYSRTMDLVNAANNSGGASQKQFNKTLESLEAKLNRLKDAWDEFMMGIANSDIIKGAIDLLSNLLEGINRLTRDLPGATKGIGNLLIMLTGFMTGKKLITAFFASTLTNIGGLAKAGTEGGLAYGMSFNTALKKEFGKTGVLMKTIFAKKTWVNAGTTAAAARASMGATLAAENQREKLMVANNIKKAKHTQLFTSNPQVYDRATASIAANEAQLKKLQATEQAYYAASIPQQNAFIAAKEAGVPIDTAKIALTKELTEEDYKQFAVQSLLAGSDKIENELTEEEIKDRVALIKAKQAELNQDKKGLLTKAGEAIMSAKNALAKKLDTAATDGSTAAKIRHTIATNIMNLSLGATVAILLATVVVIAAVVAALVWMAKEAKKQTLEYKMKKAAEATERAKEAAEGAKQAYEDLVSSLDEMKTASEELSKLTYGTIEWQKALMSVNEQVLNLIDDFPSLREELLNELQISTTGEYSLSEKGQNLIKEQKLNQYKAAYAGAVVSADYETILQKQAAQKKFDDTDPIVTLTAKGQEEQKDERTGWEKAWDFVMGIGMSMAGAQQAEAASQGALGYAITGNMDMYEAQVNSAIEMQTQGAAMMTGQMITITDDLKNKIYDKYVEDASIFTDVANEGLTQFSEEIGITNDSILKLIPSVKDLYAANLAYASELSTSYGQLIHGMSSTDFKSRKDSSGLTNTFGKFYGEKAEDDITSEKATISSADLSTYVEETLKLTGFVETDNREKDLQVIYQMLTGMSIEDIKEKFGEGTEAISALESAIANIKVGDDWAKKVENFANELDRFANTLKDSDVESVIRGAFGGDAGGGFSASDFQELIVLANNKKSSEDEAEIGMGNVGDLGSFLTQDEVVKKYNLEKLYTDSSELQGQFSTADDFYKYFYQQIIDGSIQLGSVLNNLSELLPSDSKNLDFYGKASTDAIKGVTDKLLEVFKVSGADGADAVASALSTVTAGLTEEQLNSFYAQLNGLDWSSISSLDSLKDTLYSLGIYIPESELESFLNQVKDVGKASRAVDLGTLITQLTNLQNFIKNIEDKERGDYEFSEEEKNQLIAGGLVADLFVGYGDSWRYVGNNIEELIVALKQLSSDILKDTETRLDQEKDTAIVANKLAEIGFTTDPVNQNESQKKNYLNNAILQAQGMGITQIGGISLETLQGIVDTADGTLTELQTALLDEIVTTLYTNSGQGALDVIEAKIEDNKKQAGILEYLNKPLSEITVAATSNNIVENTKATGALLYLAKGYSRLDDEVRAYNEAVESGDKDLINFTKHQLANEYAIEKAAEALKDLDGKMDDHIENLGKAKKGSKTYNETLSEIAEDFNLAFGTEITNEFFSKDGEKNLNLLKAALLGNKQAWQELTTAIQIAKLEAANLNVEITKEQSEALGAANITQYLSTVLQNLKPNKNGIIDFTNVLETLKNEGIDTLAVITALNEIGYNSLIDENGKFTGRFQSVYIPAVDYSDTFSESDRKDNKWKTSRTAFDNINADINNQAEERNRLEKEYELLLRNENSTLEDFTKNYEQRLGTLQQEIELQKVLLKMREAERKKLEESSYYGKYAWIDENGELKIDYQALSRITDSDKGEKVEEFIDALEENVESTKEAEEAIQDNTLAVEELQEEWRDQAADLEKRIYDALISEREKEIERIESIASTLEETNQDLIGAIQDEINLRRQQMENEEKEKEISDKERRLSYLQRDTSGANKQEIFELQKDLDEEKQDYTDTLIDQKISELEKQNEEAAKQRERQIKVLEYQLENDKNTGKIAAEARQILENATSPEGYRRAYQLLAKSEAVDAMTQIEREVWELDTQKAFKTALTYLNSEDFHNLGTTIIQGVTGYVDDAVAGIIQTLDNSDDGYNDQGIQYNQGDNDVSAGLSDTFLNLIKTLTGWTEDVAEKWNSLSEDEQKEIIAKSNYTEVSPDRVLKGGDDDTNSSFAETYIQTGNNWYNPDQYEVHNGQYYLKPDASPMTSYFQLDNDKVEKVTNSAGETYYRVYGGKAGEEGVVYNSKAIYQDKNGNYRLRYAAFGNSEYMDTSGRINLPEPKFNENDFVTSTNRDFFGWVNVYNKEDVKEHTDQGYACAATNRTPYVLTRRYSDTFDEWMYYIQYITRNNWDKAWAIGWVREQNLNKVIGPNGKYNRYKTGGLADFTGPAWLDGTKSKPELVLNQKDTQNFLQLKDILSSFMKNKSTINNNSTGNTSYEISINVESISSDYDVDRAAERVKQIISSEALYRNSNLINRLR